MAKDTTEAIAAVADQVGGFDLLVTTGGASVGDHDLVISGLQTRGLVVDFWQIAMRPGKPLLFGRMAAVPVLGLPGNPVSAMVCAALFLLPALALMQGLPAGPPPTVSAILGSAVKENDRRADHLRATVSTDDLGRVVVSPFPVQDSAMLRRLALADALVLRAPFAPALPAGAEVSVIRLDTLGIRFPGWGSGASRPQRVQGRALAFHLQLHSSRQRPIYHKIRPGNETRRRTGQKHHRSCHFLRPPHSPGRVQCHCLTEQRRVAMLDLFPDPTWEIGIAWRQRIDPDVPSGKLERQSFGVMHQRRLEHAVRTGSEIYLSAGDRGNHDDRGGLGLLQKRHRRVDCSHRTHHVGGEFGLPRRLVLADRQCRDVRYNNVQAAEFGCGVRNPGGQRRSVRDVQCASGRPHAARP